MEINYKKVIKLVKATDQIKLKFDLLIQESSKLNNAVKSIDYIKDMFEMWVRNIKNGRILVLHKNEKIFFTTHDNTHSKE